MSRTREGERRSAPPKTGGAQATDVLAPEPFKEKRVKRANENGDGLATYRATNPPELQSGLEEIIGGLLGDIRDSSADSSKSNQQIVRGITDLKNDPTNRRTLWVAAITLAATLLVPIGVAIEDGVHQADRDRHDEAARAIEERRLEALQVEIRQDQAFEKQRERLILRYLRDAHSTPKPNGTPFQAP